MTNAIIESTALQMSYRAGYSLYLSGGTEFEDCPFTPETELYKAWREGYEHAAKENASQCKKECQGCACK